LATTELPPAPPQQHSLLKKPIVKIPSTKYNRPEDALTYKQETSFYSGRKHKQYETQQAKATQKIIYSCNTKRFLCQESPKDKVFEPLGKTLRDNIQQKVAPLLVSQAILYNFIYRYHEYKNTTLNCSKLFNRLLCLAHEIGDLLSSRNGLFLVFLFNYYTYEVILTCRFIQQYKTLKTQT
jgi:hypothetical protein